MTIKARFDGQVFIPEGTVNLPVGSLVEIPVEPSIESKIDDSPNPHVELLELLKSFPSDPDWPEDGAAQHDHYLYGTPKRP